VMSSKSRQSALGQLARYLLWREARGRVPESDVPALLRAVAAWDSCGGARMQWRRLRDGRRRLRVADPGEVLAVFRDLAGVSAP
jgi:hypothetical protein